MLILLKNARILKMTDENIFSGSIVIKDNHIIYIGNDYESYGPFDVIKDCHQNLLMPGFKNSHAHGPMTFLRSAADSASLHDWLFDNVFPREKYLTPESVYAFHKVAILEYISSGITCSFEQYYFPIASGKAASELGFRTVLLGTFNPLQNRVKDLSRLYHEYNDVKDPLITYSYGIHAEYTTNEEEISAMKEACDKDKARFYLHIAETKSEVENCINNRHMTPVEFIYSKGLMEYGGAGFHSIYLSDHDIELYKNNDFSVVTCPGSNSKLASGIAPIRKYLENGINVALGTDGPASNNSLDMFKEMQLLNALENIYYQDPMAIKPFDILKMATVNGSKVMNLKDIDTLEVNKIADIIEIDLHAANMQPINNIISNLVYAGNKGNVILTMINGKIVYEDGNYHIDEDIDKIYAEAEKYKLEIEKKFKENL